MRSVVHRGVFLAVLVSGCSHGSGPVSLEMHGSGGREELMQNHYHAFTQTFSKNQKVNEKHEAVDFIVRNTVRKVRPDGAIEYLVDTMEKEGDVNLHDLAYPEYGEMLEYVVSKNGQVLLAGDYPPNSVFFIPPIPLPSEPVAVGETWQMQHKWISHNTGLPMLLDLVAVFKGLEKCGGRGNGCARLEISGTVFVEPEALGAAKLQSDLRGYMVFAVKEGMLVASEISSVETLESAKARVVVKSCSLGRLIEPAGYNSGTRNLSCDPSTLSF